MSNVSSHSFIIEVSFSWPVAPFLFLLPLVNTYHITSHTHPSSNLLSPTPRRSSHHPGDASQTHSNHSSPVPLIKSTLLFPHPSLWQWWMVAFTCLSPLHISLPIRLTTHIHTCWLFISGSFCLPQIPLSYSLLSTRPWLSTLSPLFSSNLPLWPPPSYAHFSHFLFFSLSLFLSLLVSPFAMLLSLALYVTPVTVSHQRAVAPVAYDFCTSWLTQEDRRRQRDDRRMIVSKGWVGLQYTRLPQEEATWAFFCSLPRESMCVYVSSSL